MFDNINMLLDSHITYIFNTLDNIQHTHTMYHAPTLSSLQLDIYSININIFLIIYFINGVMKIPLLILDL